MTIQVTFHPSLPEYARQLVRALPLGVEMVFDENAPLHCDCDGCQRERKERTTCIRGHDIKTYGVTRQGKLRCRACERIRGRASRARAKLRATVCPEHNEKWISVGGVRTCRSCELEQ